MSTPHRTSHAPRRRVSRRRYLVRRIAALVVVVALVSSVAWGASSLLDRSSTIGADRVTGDTSATVASEAPVITDPGVVVPDPTAPSVVTTTTEAGPRVPTSAEPARILIAGDSDAGTFGPYLQRLLTETGVASSELDYKVSSGLARPDFFDWPAHFRQIIPGRDPDIVVVTFGGNDSQGLTDGDNAAGQPNFIIGEPTGEGDEEWRAEYGRRVGEIIDYLGADGRTVVWVGIPNDDNPEVTMKLRVQDEVVREQVASRPGVVFIDTWARFSGKEGNWAEFVVDPRDGQGKDVRADDGFHLNTNGAEILALDIAEAVIAELRARGAAI